MFRIASCIVVLGFVAVAAAQPGPAGMPAPVPQADSEYALTIYSTADPATFDPQSIAADQAANGYQAMNYQALPGYGVVRDTRGIDLAAGDNTIKFTDVASGIDPTTVSFKSLTAPDTTSVVEQNYEYDLVSPDKLLQKYLGKSVIINRKGSTDPKTGQTQVESIEGTLLAYDAATFVLQTSNKQLPVQMVPRGESINEIKLFDLQTGLITKPTLVWKVAAKQAGKHKAQVTYQTNGLTWRADYSVTVSKDETAADVGAWVTILNQSGAAYPNAKLKLVAGDVQRLQLLDRTSERTKPRAEAGGAGGEAQFTEKSLFEYHLYTLGRTTSLANNSTKQIELFPTRSGVPVEKTYVYYGMPDWRWIPYENAVTERDLGTECNKKVDTYVKIKNAEKNGMGIPLPAGRIRVYKRDEADAAQEFVGEDLIQHTPKDEVVLIKLGSAFELVGERKQTEFHIDENNHRLNETVEVKLRNHKDVPVNIIVKEILFRWKNWQITKCSDKYEKEDYHTIHIPVDVPANGEKTVTYEVLYTW